MTNDMSQEELPGIGRRFDFPVLQGGQVSVVMHHNGRRDVYVIDRDGNQATVAMMDDQARQVGSILAGAFFKPALIQQIESLIGGLLVDWVTVRETSPVANRSIRDLMIRSVTHMTIVAIVRDDHSIVAPEPDERILANDTLLVVGRVDDLPGFLSHVIG